MSVTVYSTTSCPYCFMVKDYLKAKNVVFNDYDVGRDQNKANEMIRISGQMGVPVLNVNGSIIVGFNKPAIDKALVNN
ncbi:MAG TPA: glutaredoxin domain-containing protein [Spirochaetota bacterium]|nr:glutaredoxin domain-containing protein [Spirochaetota bacterium]